MKKRKNKRNKKLAFVMAVVLAAGISIPAMINWTGVARAAANEPSLHFFATAEQLMRYDELSRDSDNPNNPKEWVGLLNFGKKSANAIEWYIVGKDDSNEKDNVMLFAVKSMKTGFFWDGNLTADDRIQDNVSEKKAYSGDPSIHYEDGTSPTEVNLNHYGDSDVRKEFLRLQTDGSVFSAAEQKLMLPTAVSTKDSLNNKMYTVEDILYAPTVGSEDAEGVISNPGKRNICLLVGGGSDESKMRKVYAGYSYASNVWLRVPSTSRWGGNPRTVYDWNSLYGELSETTVYFTLEDYQPAFALDLTDVLFASGVPTGATASGGRELVYQPTGMNLRMADQGNRFKSTNVSYSQDTINYSGVPAGTSLVVQGKTEEGKDWYYKITASSGTGRLTWENVRNGVSGVSIGTAAAFQQCRVWLETTASDGLTYALLGINEAAEDTKINSVRITDIAPVPEQAFGTNASCKTEGVLSSTPAVTWSENGGAVSGSTVEYDKTYIASITLTAEEGYIFADNPTASVEGGEVTKVTRNGDKSITVTCRFITEQDVYLPKLQYTGGDRYSGVYDDMPHTITPVVVSEPTDAVVRYGTRKGDYTLDAPPEFTDAGSYRVWFRIEKEGYETVEKEVGVEIRKRTISIYIEDQTIRWGEEIDKTRYRAEGDLVSGHEITEVNLTPSTKELTEDGVINLFARDPITIVDREENNKDVSKNYEVRLESSPGKLVIEHDPELPPKDELEVSKEKTEYTVGDELDVNDITVTVKYEDGYTTEVSDYETNADEIDMSVPGEKIVTVTYTENGKTVTGEIPIQVNGEAINNVSEPGQDEPNQSSGEPGQAVEQSSSGSSGSGAGSGGGSGGSGGGTILTRTITGAAKTADGSPIIQWVLLLICSGVIVIGVTVMGLSRGKGKNKKELSI